MDATVQHGVAVLAYVLMSNHLYLLATPRTASSAPKALQPVGRRYCLHFNGSGRRSGTLFEGLSRATAVEADAYIVRLMHYMELNPVPAGTVASPEACEWSRNRANALGEPDAWVSRQWIYQSYDTDDAQRTRVYRGTCATFATGRDDTELEKIRNATNKGWTLGSGEFLDVLEIRSGRQAVPRVSGRKLGSNCRLMKSGRRRLNRV